MFAAAVGQGARPLPCSEWGAATAGMEARLLSGRLGWLGWLGCSCGVGSQATELEAGQAGLAWHAGLAGLAGLRSSSEAGHSASSCCPPRALFAVFLCSMSCRCSWHSCKGEVRGEVGVYIIPLRSSPLLSPPLPSPPLSSLALPPLPP